MSADLFAAFGDTSQASDAADDQGSSTPWPSLVPAASEVNPWDDLGGANSAQDDDGWGEFKAAPQATSNPTNEVIPTRPTPSRTRILRVPTLDVISNRLVDVGSEDSTSAGLDSSWKERSPWETAGSLKKKPDPNVLFDADDYNGAEANEDDDFGDFAVASPQTPVEQFARLSVSSPYHTMYPQTPKSPSFQERNPYPGLKVTTPTPMATEFSKEIKEELGARSPSPITPWPSGDVEASPVIEPADFELETPVQEKKKPSSAINANNLLSTNRTLTNSLQLSEAATDWEWDAWDDTDNARPSFEACAPPEPQQQSRQVHDHVSGPPPTNVPPPCILLSLFPELLRSANTALLKPLTGQPSAVKDRVLADPATVTFLRGHLALATVAGRLMAGRKLRWHRDKFLAQGMSLAAASNGGGMRLAGIDKSQAAREDAEAADVAAAWRDGLGRLRAVVAAANAALASGQGGGGHPLRIPELPDETATMTAAAAAAVVQTAKNVMTAPKPCVVCGLRRDERVARLDFDVEDSFGEWWIEFWGHRACTNFWLEHEGKLRQR